MLTLTDNRLIDAFDQQLCDFIFSEINVGGLRFYMHSAFWLGFGLKKLQKYNISCVHVHLPS